MRLIGHCGHCRISRLVCGGFSKMYFRKLFSHGNNLRKRTVFCIAIVFIFIILVSLLFANLFEDTSKYQVNAMQNLIMSNMRNQVTGTIASLKKTAIALAYAIDVQNALFSPWPLTRMQHLKIARNSLMNYSILDEGIIDIIIYKDRLRKISAGPTIDKRNLQKMEAVNMQIYDDSSSYILSNIFISETGIQGFTITVLFRSAIYPSATNDIGLCAIHYRVNSLINVKSSATKSNHLIAISDQEGFFPVTPMSELMIQNIESAPGESNQLMLGEKQYIYFTFELPETEWKVHYSFPQDEVISASSISFRRGFTLIAVGSTIIIIVILYNLLFIAWSINKVITSAASVSRKEIARIEAVGLPEMKILSNQINSLLAQLELENISKRIAQKNYYQAILAKNEAEMAFYRNQISPHFLFNTLECIRSMAKHGSVLQVEKLITATTGVLHYSLYSQITVPFSCELNNARNYIEIMRARRMNSFEFREIIDKSVLEYPMASMVLQPLLENSFQHGSKSLRNRKLIIHMKASPLGTDKMHISIIDNGMGINKKEQSRINKLLQNASNDGYPESIGLDSVDTR